MSAIVNPRDILMQAAPTRLLPVVLPPNVVIPALVPDLNAPPAPTGLAVAAAIVNLIITHDTPAFTLGHGYLRTNVYGAIWLGGSDPLPVFADAVKVNSFSGVVGPHPTNPATSWRIWATWVSKDGTESPPAGGTNGIAARTGEDVEKLVAALTGPGNPFVVLTEPTEIDGVTYPAGPYSAAAFIIDAQITKAKIKDLAVDDAKIVSLAVAKLLAGALGVDQYIESSNYSLADGTGFRLHADGTLSLPNGSVTAKQINATNLNVVNGTFSGSLSGATGTFSGALSGATGEFGGTLRAGVVDLSTSIGITAEYGPGTHTLTVPSGKTSLRMTLQGGGGGGGGGSYRAGMTSFLGGGGGGGGYISATYDNLTPGDTYTLSVGSGGGGGQPRDGTYGTGTDGTGGGSTYISTLSSVTGGGGGLQAGNSATGGAGGNGTGAAAGGSPGSSTTVGGAGGDSHSGVGGAGGIGGPGGAAAVAGSRGTGGGGGGGIGSVGYAYTGGGVAGASGGDGFAVIEFFDKNGVILRTEYNLLKTALNNQGISTQ